MTARAQTTPGGDASPDAYQGEHFVFIVGSPRSGTTITAETLSRHPDIVYFYEPYYLWKHGSGNGLDDELSPSDVDDATLSFIRRHCHHFWKRSGARFVIEQSPEESLMLPLLQCALPRARFIHMIRDGYDCIRSITVEWQKRAELVQSRNPVAIANKVIASLARQPFWRFRLLQLGFELCDPFLLGARELEIGVVADRLTGGRVAFGGIHDDDAFREPALEAPIHLVRRQPPDLAQLLPGGVPVDPRQQKPF